jgi:hypothetical protein
MLFRLEEKPSDSPFIERIWRTRGEQAGEFISLAKAYSEIVLTRYEGKATLTIRGPETRATFLDYQSVGAEFLGITFKLGTFMPHLPPLGLRDWQNVDLPELNSSSFWLQGSAWQFPSYENVDTFIARLVHQDLLVADPMIPDALKGYSPEMTNRSVQYRFLHSTGLSKQKILQIRRAEKARFLLEQGSSIADTVYESGYSDQPHMTRSLKHFFGQTPRQLGKVIIQD